MGNLQTKISAMLNNNRPLQSQPRKSSIKMSYTREIISCLSRVGLMVNALVFGSSGRGSSPGRGHFVVFLGKTSYSYSAFLHTDVQMGTEHFNYCFYAILFTTPNTCTAYSTNITLTFTLTMYLLLTLLNN